MANTHSIDLELSSSQYLSITDANQTGLDITGDMTLEAWVKFESLPASDDTYGLINKYSVDTERSFLFRFFNSSGTQQLLFTNSDDGSAVASETINWSPSVATWYHIAVVYDASAGSYKAYVNGSQQGTTKTGLKTSIYNSSAPFDIGNLRNISGDAFKFFDGLIDEVRVWNDIRTPTEISDNYQAELIGDEAGLVGYWKLNNSLLDETSNDNDLTNNNSATFSTDVPFVGESSSPSASISPSSSESPSVSPSSSQSPSSSESPSISPSSSESPSPSSSESASASPSSSESSSESASPSESEGSPSSSISPSASQSPSSSESPSVSPSSSESPSESASESSSSSASQSPSSSDSPSVSPSSSASASQSPSSSESPSPSASVSPSSSVSASPSPSAIFTNEPKNSTTWTNESDNSTTWTNTNKSF